jgi:uncharacterized membrane protein HdeD (DUF308 family)
MPSSFAIGVPSRWSGMSAYVVAEGVLLSLLGLAAIAFPIVASIATAVLFGWILIASGVVGLVGTIKSKPHLHFGWSLVSSVLTIVAGLVVAFYPLSGVITLVVVVAAWLALDGVSALMIGLDLKRTGGRAWGWSIASAAVDWILAACLLLLGPIGGAVAVGIIVGIDLALGGASLVMLGFAGRSAA